MSENVTPLPNAERDELLGALDQMSRVWKAMALRSDEIAAARKTMFDAYQRQGFSDAQALELCKSMTI